MKKIITSLLFLSLFVVSCTKDPEQRTPQTGETSGETVYETLPDPFSTDVAQAVFDSLGVDIKVEPNHKYVRLKLNDIDKIEAFQVQYELPLFEYPLDIDIPEGEVYVDPDIPEGEIGWHYTTVPYDFEFPTDMEYEVIRELFIPNDDMLVKNLDGDMVEVEGLMYERMGYETDDPTTRSGGGGGQKPKGHIYVRDDSATNLSDPTKHVKDKKIYEPVKGVRVKINSLTKIRWRYTNEDGYFESDWKFWDKDVRYTVVFINPSKDFIIWRVANANSKSPSFGRCKFDLGKHSKSGQDFYFESGEQRQCAVINAAAWDYYEMCEKTGEEISKPPKDLKILFCPASFANMFGGGSNAFMARRLYLGAGGGSIRNLLKTLVKTVGGYSGFISDGVASVIETNAPDLMISSYDGDGIALSYSEIYNTMHHELSHASHFSKVGDDYWEKYCRHTMNSLIDTKGVLCYGDGSEQYAGNSAVGEMWGWAMGDIRECEEYNNPRLSRAYQDGIDDFERPEENLTGGGWIHPDPLWALITRGVLTKKQVFDCLTTDVDTVEKLEEKMCSLYPDKEAQINEAFTNNDVVPTMPPITGLTYSGKNHKQTFSVPTELEHGITFDRFLVTGGDYSVTGNMTDRTITVKFLEAKLYTITARYRFGGAFHTVTKGVNAGVVPAAPETPVLSCNATSSVAEYAIIDFYVSNPQEDVSYEWVYNGQILEGQTGSSISVETEAYAHNHSIDMICMARNNSYHMPSDWSNKIFILVRDELVLATPVVRSDKSTVKSGDVVKFTVEEPQWDVIYEWKYNDNIVAGQTGSSISLTMLGNATYHYSKISCQGRHKSGEVSFWSSACSVLVM